MHRQMHISVVTSLHIESIEISLSLVFLSVSVMVLLFVVRSSDVIVAGQPREQNRIPLCTEGRPRTLSLSLCHNLTVCAYTSPLCSLGVSHITKPVEPISTRHLPCSAGVKRSADKGKGRKLSQKVRTLLHF